MSERVSTERLREMVAAERGGGDTGSTAMRKDQRAAVRELLVGAYAERNCVVAGLAVMAQSLGCPVWLARHIGDPWDCDWRNVIFIGLPSGQVSWHFHDNEMPMFSRFQKSDVPWDGHSTPEKYRRLAEATYEHLRGIKSIAALEEENARLREGLVGVLHVARAGLEAMENATGSPAHKNRGVIAYAENLLALEKRSGK